jgi:hypothetical protein
MQQAHASLVPSTSTWKKIMRAIRATLTRTNQCPQNPIAPKMDHQPQDHLPQQRDTNPADSPPMTSTPMENGDPHQTGLLGRLCRSQRLRQIRNLGHTPQNDTSPQSLSVHSLFQQACQWLHQETLHRRRQVQELTPCLHQNIWALTRCHPRNTPRRPNHLSPPPQSIWLGPAVSPSYTTGHPPLFETPIEPSLNTSPPWSPTPPSRSNPHASTCPSLWGVKYPWPSHEWHLNHWLEHIPTRTVGLITYETRLESENNKPLHPLTQKSNTRHPHPRPLPRPPPASPSPSTPPEWDYLPRYNPRSSPQPMRPPPTSTSYDN